MTRARDPRIYLWNAERSAADIEEFAGDMTLAAFLDDLTTLRAVEYCFIRLGAALERLRLHRPELAARVPRAEELAEYGEHLVRDYDRVDAAGVWRRSREQAPEVRQAVRALLGELNREAGLAATDGERTANADSRGDA